jgi:ribonuclease P protein component
VEQLFIGFRLSPGILRLNLPLSTHSIPEYSNVPAFKTYERLKSRKLIALLFSEGKSLFDHPVKMVWMKLSVEEEPKGYQPQVMFSVSKRYFKKAVQRNRIKRQMREAYRLQKQELIEIVDRHKQKVTIGFIFAGQQLPEYSQIALALKKLQQRLITDLTPAAE